MDCHKNDKIQLIFVFAVFLCSGCTFDRKHDVNFLPQICKAVYTPNSVCVDGKLNDLIWQDAQPYPLSLSMDKANSQVLHEKGYVKFAWNETHFYLAASFMDSDLVAQGQKDEMHHYRYGDLCELFLKPIDQSYYWELYVTPKGKKSSFFWPSRGYLGLPDCLEKYTSGLKVSAHCDGTLNNWQDKDTGWTMEMAMPVKDLEAFGYEFGPGHNWTIFVSRYNYSRYLSNKELSMFPQLSQTSYHLYEEYGILYFEKPLTSLKTK